MNAQNKKPIILCVDDEQIVLDSMGRQLKRHFKDRCDYEFAESAEEANEIIHDLVNEGQDFIVVITDQIMPGMKGDEFLSKLYQQYPNLVTILLTGQASLDAAIKIINSAHLYRYIAKPWEENDLILTIEKGLEQYFLLQQSKQQFILFDKFVPNQFLKNLSKQNILDIKLGDNIKREMTILFSDIRGFTTMSEEMSPEECFKFINNYLHQVEKGIHQNHGFIDKFIGDAVMALFNTPIDAIKAAIQMHKNLEEFNQKRLATSEASIETNIGIHTGDCMLGIVGVTERMQSTVISDAVNLASRIENLSSLYSSALLITENTKNKLPENCFSYRYLGKMRLKGKLKENEVYEVLEAEKEEDKNKKMLTKDDFETGIKLYFSRDFAEASVKFNSVVKINPKDKAAKYYLKKSAENLLHLPENWDGVEVLEEK